MGSDTDDLERRAQEFFEDWEFTDGTGPEHPAELAALLRDVCKERDERIAKLEALVESCSARNVADFDRIAELSSTTRASPNAVAKRPVRFAKRWGKSSS